MQVDLLDWGVIYGKLDHRCTDDFVNTLLHVGPSLGMIVNEPKHVLKLDDDRIDTYMRALKFLKDRQIQIVVLVFPTLRTDRYTAVKYYCNVDAGMSSQVIQTYSLTKKKSLRSTVLSIALQMNCKMGGSLWTTPNPFKSVMVVGIDVYHDTKNRSRSVVGVVSSLNQNLTHYFSQVIYQDPKQELIDGLRHCFIESIRHYFNVNNKFPARIFVFRDGVGDGQLRTLVAYEVEQLINCFPSLTRDEVYEPKFTVVVVQKRINTKIFAARPQDQFENPPPGTVVDHTITKKFMYDFILVSQFAHHGTVNPTHYLVLYDNSQLKPDYLQRFTFKLCHMYFNWMGIIRVPAPCQYAHRLAAHAGLHLKTGFHPVLAERLFYL
ncbi:Argonaute-3 [Ephemera danica]|nr:Argonaute-3 [Ephemera danica]